MRKTIAPRRSDNSQSGKEYSNFSPPTLVTPASNHLFEYRSTLPYGTCTVNFPFVEAALEIRPNMPEPKGTPNGKLIHLALTVRWSLVGEECRGSVEVACTYDIHQHGARLLSSRAPNVGDLVLVERGRNKAICQVVWAADENSPLRGQFSVQCVEGRTPWDDELRQVQVQVEEQYQPVILDPIQRRRSASGFPRPEDNRRRTPRFYVDGQAEVIDGVQHVAGAVEQISEFGARISAPESLRPGTDFRLMLNVLDVSLALTAEVKYLCDSFGMGVEFREIRRGDRPLLGYVLSKLKTRRVDEFARVEVVSETALPAAI
jgi:hypothetical protein